MPFLTGSLLQRLFPIGRKSEGNRFYALSNGQSVATQKRFKTFRVSYNRFYALSNGQSVATDPFFVPYFTRVFTPIFTVDFNWFT